MHVAGSGVLRATPEPNGICDGFATDAIVPKRWSIVFVQVVENQLLQSDFLIGDFLTLADIVLVRHWGGLGMGFWPQMRQVCCLQGFFYVASSGWTAFPKVCRWHLGKKLVKAGLNLNMVRGQGMPEVSIQVKFVDIPSINTIVYLLAVTFLQTRGVWAVARMLTIEHYLRLERCCSMWQFRAVLGPMSRAKIELYHFEHGVWMTN